MGPEVRRKSGSEEEAKGLQWESRSSLSDQLEAAMRWTAKSVPAVSVRDHRARRCWGWGLLGGRSGDCGRLPGKQVYRLGYASASVLRLSTRDGPGGEEDAQEQGGVATRSSLEKFEEVDEVKLRELMDAWVLEYDEMLLACS